MKIKQIFYKELISGDRYSHKEIAAWADVENTTPEDAFTGLVFWVKEQFHRVGVKSDELVELQDNIYAKTQELERINANIKHATEKINKMGEFLKKHGVDLFSDDSIPF